MKINSLLIVLLSALPLLAQAQTPAAAPSASAGDNKSVSTTPAAAPSASAGGNKSSSRTPAAANVVLVTGSATVGARTLSAGDKVNAGDTIVTGNNSYANLKFADGGRILLRPNTEFTVEAFTAVAPVAPSAVPGAAPAQSQVQTQAESGQAFFRLLRGGFRAISGLIGKANRQSYRVTTSVATIGIRGTDYEVQLCASDCPTDGLPKSAGTEAVQLASSDLSSIQLAQAGGSSPPGGGLVLATNEGSVVLQTPRGEFVVDVGQVALTLANGQTFKLPAIPDMLLLQQTPSPENCK